MFLGQIFTFYCIFITKYFQELLKMSKKCIFLIIAESAQIFESGNGPEMQKLDKCTCLCRFSWFSVIYIESRDSAFVRPN